MPSIIIDRFGGMKPGEKRGSGDASRASVARNSNLEYGSLKPWRYPSLELETTNPKLCSIWKHECCFFASENPCATFARSDTQCDRVFSTDVMPWPAYAVATNASGCAGTGSSCEKLCDYTWCRLGVPAPPNAPTFLALGALTPAPAMPVTTSTYDCTTVGNYKLDDWIEDVANEDDPDYQYAGPDAFCDTAGYPNTNDWNMNAGKQVKREPRSYFITFVNEFGEESRNSPISNTITTDYTATPRLGIVIPPITGGYCNPTYIRLYRVVPVHSTPDEKEVSLMSGDNPLDFDSAVDSAAFLVAEIPFRTGNIEILDDTLTEDFGDAFQGWKNEPPLPDLKNIAMLENGTLVASRKNELWFSEPWNFHAWNCAMNLDDCIINLKVVGIHIYVATDAYPYLVSSQPNEDESCRCCRNVNRLTESAPIVSRNSMVTTNVGVMWSSSVGLVRMNGAELRVISHDYMTEHDWQSYLPHQIRGEFYKGKYFGFNDTRGFIFDIVDGIYNDGYIGETGRLTELDLTPDTVYRSDSNDLYMTFGGDIFKWNASDTFMSYVWRSKLHVEAGLRNYSTMKVVFEKWLRSRMSPNPVTVRLFADDKMMFERKVSCSRPFRLPKGFDAINFEIEVTGIEAINEIHMATSMVEMTNLNNT